MRKAAGVLVLSLSLAIPSASWAMTDPFVGTWKLNPSKSKFTDQMKVESLGGNTYAFDFGGGQPVTVVADGSASPVTSASASLSPSKDLTPGRPSARKTAACSLLQHGSFPQTATHLQTTILATRPTVRPSGWTMYTSAPRAPQDSLALGKARARRSTQRSRLRFGPRRTSR